MAAQGLDVGEDVVPAAAVEACRMLPQLVQDLVHLKGSWQGLNQHCCLQIQASGHSERCQEEGKKPFCKGMLS